MQGPTTWLIGEPFKLQSDTSLSTMVVRGEWGVDHIVFSLSKMGKFSPPCLYLLSGSLANDITKKFELWTTNEVSRHIYGVFLRTEMY